MFFYAFDSHIWSCICIVRSGINSGQLIEDEGVKADIIVRPKPEDFYANATISSQFYTIASHLVDIAVKDPSRSFECKKI